MGMGMMEVPMRAKVTQTKSKMEMVRKEQQVSKKAATRREDWRLGLPSMPALWVCRTRTSISRSASPLNLNCNRNASRARSQGFDNSPVVSHPYQPHPNAEHNSIRRQPSVPATRA